jgi:acyl carrier protein
VPRVTADQVLDLLVERIRTVMGLETDERVLHDKPGWREVSWEDDLHADSLDLVEVVEGVEQELRRRGVPIRVGEADLEGVRLVGDTADVIVAQAAASERSKP